MSNIAELADLEASIAEAELTDDEADRVKAIAAEGVPVADAIAQVLSEREPEGDAEPELATPVDASGEPAPMQLKSLDREQARHEARVHAIMGVYVAGFETCQACSGVGLVPPGPKPQSHEFFIACETCAGFGQVKTGSLRAGNEARDCPACKGRGYLEALDASGVPIADQNRPALAASAAPVAAPPEAPNGNGAAETAGVTFGTPAWMGDTSLGR